MRKKIVFSPDATTEVGRLVAAVKDVYTKTIDCYLNDDTDLAKEIGPLRIVISEMCDAYKANHVERLSQGICEPGHGFVFNDILYSCGRIADHSLNIAAIVYRFRSSGNESYVHDFKQRKTAESEALYHKYLKKYFSEASGN